MVETDSIEADIQIHTFESGSSVWVSFEVDVVGVVSARKAVHT
jgi:hypothetical protein